MFKLEDCIGFITSRGAKKLSEEFNRRTLEYGITRVQWIAMYYIGEKEAITQKELSEKMGIKESTMVRLIDRMEKDDLVIRCKDKEDRRITNISLTSKGVSMRLDLMPVGENFSKDATKGVEGEELVIFTKVLDKMMKNIEEYIDNATQ